MDGLKLYIVNVLVSIEMSDDNAYRKLTGQLNSYVAKKAGVLIVSLPGLGASFFLKKFAQENGGDGVIYITSEQDDFGAYNIADLNFAGDSKALVVAERILAMVSPQQKVAFILNAPYLLEDKDFLDSAVGRHTFGKVYLPVRNETETKELALETDPKFDLGKLSEIYSLSGGVPRLVKFLVVNGGIFEEKDSSEVERLIMPTVKAAVRTKKDVLMSLGIWNGSKYVGDIINMVANGINQEVGLLVKDDLSLVEDGAVVGKVTLLEKSLINLVLGYDGILTKEKIAEIKWGEASYAEFSDQAISKTIQRLNKKMVRHFFEPIINVGYKLRQK